MLTAEECTRLEPFLANALEAKVASITAMNRFHGGASRETYGLDVEADGASHGLILRRDPADSLIDTERAVEYAAYQSYAGTGVPVPGVVALVEDTALLGAPFFVMERIEGGEAGSPFVAETFGEHRASVGRDFFRLLGLIHAQDMLSTPLAKLVEIPTPDRCWARELDFWEREINTDALEPQPIAQAAIRWLRRHGPPPVPQRLTVVHGDYRVGNVLHDGAGGICAVLDWEMAHIGDPHEDLAWALSPLWNVVDEGLAAGLTAFDEAIAIWESASGLRFNPLAFRWWEIFASVKGLGIWISAGRAFADGTNSDPILCFSGLYPLAKDNQVLAHRLAARLGEAA